MELLYPSNVTQMPKRIQYNTNIKPNVVLICNGTTTDNNSLPFTSTLQVPLFSHGLLIHGETER
jgi:hypothetical protein